MSRPTPLRNPRPVRSPGGNTPRTVPAIAGTSVLTLALLATPATAAGPPPSAGATSPDRSAASRPAVPVGQPGRRPGPVGHTLPHVPSMTGGGGAVASVDPVASQVGIDVLKSGGNAADAAVATAAALGVVEPYANGVGGGGFFVYFEAATGRVSTIDGRETAPAALRPTSFLEKDGKPMAFDKAVNSGLSVGVPGTPATWQAVLDRWGTRSMWRMLEPAQRIAERGFVVDKAFTVATEENAARFAKFPATAKIFLPGGKPVQPGTVLRQPDLAKTYHALRRGGAGAFYRGALAKDLVAVVNKPVTAPGVTVPAGGMALADLSRYRALPKAPVRSTYHGYDVFGMPVPSSGGIALAEALNLLEQYEKRTGRPLSRVSRAQYLHRFAEATATAFADRNRWVGDVPGVPVTQLISKGFAAERACGFNPAAAQARPIAFGQPDGSYRPCASSPGRPGTPHEGQSTTHLTVVDRKGNVAAYTLTIEQFGGSGMVLPGWGFLLNNELTDFEFAPLTPGVPHPNLPAPGKRPRSSMSPTIVLHRGRPVLAVGAAGGSTIITTTLQTITGHLSRGMSLLDALAQPRLSSRNTAATAEPELINSPVGAELKALGQPMTPAPTIGRGTAIRIWGRGRLTAVAEPVRGGGGSGMVVAPERRR